MYCDIKLLSMFCYLFKVHIIYDYINFQSSIVNFYIFPLSCKRLIFFKESVFKESF